MSTNPRDIRGFEILERVIADSLGDDDYRDRLKKDPASVLGAAGLSIPDGVEIVVHENSADTVHLVLPATPEPGQVLELDEIDVVMLSMFWPF